MCLNLPLTLPEELRTQILEFVSQLCSGRSEPIQMLFHCLQRPRYLVFHGEPPVYRYGNEQFVSINISNGDRSVPSCWPYIEETGVAGKGNMNRNLGHVDVKR